MKLGIVKNLIWVLVFISLISCGQPEPEIKSVPLPVLPKVVKLRVAHLVNPRFVSMDEQQISEVLDIATILVWENFGIQVEFQQVGKRGLSRYFDGIPPVVKEYRQRYIVDPVNLSDGDIEELVLDLTNTLEGYEVPVSTLQEYAKPYLVSSTGSSIQALAKDLTDTLVKRQQYWRKVNALDGLPVISRKQPWHEWVWWDSLGYGDLDFDLAITNQLVASMESYGQDMHSSLRGGITLGTTSNSKTEYGTFAWVSTFPVLNDHRPIMILRNEKSYEPLAQTEYVAGILTHEIGHLLLHLSHPWGEKACVMAPTPVLDYAGWYEALDAEKCKVGSHPANTVGAADIAYELFATEM